LKHLYTDWYGFFTSQLSTLPVEGEMLELGSGGGFLKQLIPTVITSDIIELPTNDRVVNAELLPFADNSLSAIFMIDVLHHIPNCDVFFAEAQRTLKVGGKILMSEPANTPFSRFFYKYLHHEPFDTSGGWKIAAPTGPLTGANGAIPWIVFNRDLDKFTANYPQLQLVSTQLHTPFRYILSGGMTPYSLVPKGSFNFFTKLEKKVNRLYPMLAMFQFIEVVKIN